MRRALRGTACLLAAACGEGTAPRGDIPVTVRVCNPEVVWFAYQNANDRWREATPDVSGRVSFDATAQASIAFSHRQAGSRRFNQVIHATAAQLDGLVFGQCPTSGGLAQVSSRVIVGSQVAFISAGTDAVVTTTSPSDWTLTLPVQPVDVVVGRVVAQASDRLIVRRAITPANQTLAPFDLDGSEAVDASSSTLTVAGAPGGSPFYLTALLTTAGGTRHEMSRTTSTSPVMTIPSLPPALRVSGDVHCADVAANDGQGVDYRRRSWCEADPGDRSLAFGPAVAASTITTVSSIPHVRQRVSTPIQLEYPDAVSVWFFDGSTSGNQWTIVTTAARLGGLPSKWTTEIPDLREAGFQPEWGLRWASSQWDVSAYSGNLDLAFGNTAAAGTSLSAATRRHFGWEANALVSPVGRP